ncbi:MAG: hypothetical protein OXT05_14165 [Chloroflexota bacterium]|nr:hypothetical protein [Chloroflexota bacterium]
MAHRIIDTNVPLTAAGMNTEASDGCKLSCEQVISRILKGEVTVVIDEDDEAILEYRQNMYPDLRGTRAGQFLFYLLTNMQRPSRIRKVRLQKNERGQYLAYPDSEEAWTTNDPRCERFDPDDKKWVALAARFKKDTGTDAPIVNAADRCWLAFEYHLESAGVKLESLCREERQRINS